MKMSTTKMKIILNVFWRVFDFLWHVCDFMSSSGRIIIFVWLAKLIEVSASSLMSKRILPSVNNGEEKTLFYGDYLHL